MAAIKGATPCPKNCGKPHTTVWATLACIGHISSGDNKGDPCKQPPIHGLKVCRFHGANKNARAAANRRLEQEKAEKAMRSLGLPVAPGSHPADILLEEVRWTAGHVQWLRGRVQELDAAGTARLDDHPLVWGETKSEDKGAGQFTGTNTTHEAKPSVWYELYSRERDRLVVACAAALRAGVDERRVRLAESQGDLVAGAIKRILTELNLTPEQQERVGEVVPRQLRLLAGGAA